MPIAASTVGSDGLLRSASAIVAGTESGQHLLKIDGYSRTKNVPTGSHIKTRSFHVGGHSWHILYYPSGIADTCSDYISIFLKLAHNVPQGVKAQYTFSLLDHEGKPVPHYTMGSDEVKIFREPGWGFWTFISRDELEKSEHLRDDSFTIRCDFTVMKEIETKDIDIDETPRPPVVVVPPPDLHHHLGGLLATGECADVAFEVETKTFAAHRCVLSARSPVFRAELAGLSKDSAATTDGAVVVPIQDMEAQDFEALLHYMYTDSLPEMKGETAAMLLDLVAAANRYKMERLRLVCEDKLCEFVNARTVAIMLAFAEEHHCHGLKEASLQFLEDPKNLREVAKISLEHLTKSCPSVFKDIFAKLAAAP